MDLLKFLGIAALILGGSLLVSAIVVGILNVIYYKRVK